MGGGLKHLETVSSAAFSVCKLKEENESFCLLAKFAVWVKC